MRLCRFGEDRLGIVENGAGGIVVRDVTAAFDVLPQVRYPVPRHDLFIANLDAVKARVRALAPTAAEVPLEGLKLLSPVANPGKIVAAPLNYEKHIAEVQSDDALHQGAAGSALNIRTAGVFLKATSSLVGPGEGVVLRSTIGRTDHEVELVFVIGRTASRVSKETALSHVAGYCIGLDISARGTQDRSFRKSADSYSVIGPWLVTADEIADPDALDLTLRANGQIRQQSNTSQMTLGVAELIAVASSMYTLYPGDVFFTGTPEGVSPIEPGDEIVATIESIGSMTTMVRADRSAATAWPPATAGSPAWRAAE